MQPLLFKLGLLAIPVPQNWVFGEADYGRIWTMGGDVPRDDGQQMILHFEFPLEGGRIARYCKKRQTRVLVNGKRYTSTNRCRSDWIILWILNGFH